MSEEKATEDLTDFDPADTVPDKVENSQSAEESREFLRKERDDLRDRWLRKEAEIQNFRKRVARERIEVVDSVRASVLQTILPVIDSSEKGIDLLEAQTQSGDLQVYRDGIQLLVKELKGVLTRFEVSEVPGVGHSFDPTVHESLAVEQTDSHAEGEVMELFRKGYTMKGRLLRPAQVKVASADPAKEE
mgnify:CR=1 FL=1